MGKCCQHRYNSGFHPQQLRLLPVRTFILLIVTLALLSACGQKGPLYLPQPEGSAAQSAEEQADAASSNTTKETTKKKAQEERGSQTKETKKNAQEEVKATSPQFVSPYLIQNWEKVPLGSPIRDAKINIIRASDLKQELVLKSAMSALGQKRTLFYAGS